MIDALRCPVVEKAAGGTLGGTTRRGAVVRRELGGELGGFLIEGPRQRQGIAAFVSDSVVGGEAQGIWFAGLP